MEHWAVGAVLAFLLGAGVAFLNYLVSRAVLRKKPERYAISSVIRQFINVSFLVALYFLAPVTPWEQMVLPIGGAVGMTVGMPVFTGLLLRKTKSADAEKNPGNPENKGSDC